MRKKLQILLTQAALFLSLNTSANAVETIKVGVHYNPPLCSIDSTNQAEGIFIDLLNKVADVNNWHIDYIPLTFTEGIDALKYGKIQLLTTVARTQKREQLINFSNETIFTNWGIIYTNKNSRIESITDLQHKKLALEKGDIHAQALLKLLANFNINAEIIWCQNPTEVFNKINNNEAEAGAVNKLFGYRQNLDQKLRVTPILFNPVNVHFAGGPLSQPLLDKVDEALIKFKLEEPELYQDTINQWLIKDAKQSTTWVLYLTYALSGLTLILIIALLIQRSIVKKRTDRLHEARKISAQRGKTIKQIEHEKTLILNSLDEQVVFIDNDYNLVWANDAFKKTSDTPFEKLVGTKCYKANFKRDTPCEFCQFETSLLTNRTEVREHVSEISGKTYIHKTHPVFDNEHQHIGFVEILSDISEKKKHEQELIKAKEKAEQSDYLKSAFLANMSHEIRTPMNAIIGFSELLEDESLSTQEKKSYLHIIQSNGNQLLKLISDILIFSQIESGHVKLHYSLFQIDQLLNETYEQFKSEINKYDKALDIILDSKVDESLKLESDQVRIKQIIFNLLTNAIKFTDKGSITLGAYTENAHLTIYVKDTGIGIPKDKHEEVFKRFSQVENNQIKKASGSGLGLTIAHDLIKQLGGFIRLESEVGKGSTFYLVHPLKRKIEPAGTTIFNAQVLNSRK
ncbi:transporter substrate-binding domain-containing protein [Carboxylicivirga sp. A043]|uniref:ATP-binding protein n=1 Tax=Carboxylicivirga litoralis TaxID=2816963 RepID=UPI0021CAE799|nr:ATP-binding protein [Carboxylicivirga sp. A043]MCU4156243.1 transporter substrate-binding domain-containing protein [Carboxylicivirga sp. A043]